MSPYEKLNRLNITEPRARILALSHEPTKFVTSVSEAATLISWELQRIVRDWDLGDSKEAREARALLNAMIARDEETLVVARSVIASDAWAIGYLDWLDSIKTKIQEAVANLNRVIAVIMKDEVGIPTCDVGTVPAYLRLLREK